MKSTADYRQDFQYENGTLQFIAQPEGYIYKDATGYRYVYRYKDHLGNNRLSFMRNAGTVAIVKETNYYPFGLTHQGYNNLTTSLGSAGAKKYMYNGKELQEDFGLDWYDYGARFYEPTIARWNVIDPMFNRHYDWSPYAYVLNNPLGNIDLYGLTDWKAIWKGSAMVIGGLASTIGGVAAASTPTGVGQVTGTFLVTTGVPTMGVGIGMIAAGIKDDGTSKKIPGGPVETTGIIGDKLLGNENDELRKAGSVGDIVLNLAAGAPKTAIEQVALGVQVATTVSDIIDTDNNTQTNKSSSTVNSGSNTVPEIKRDNTNVVTSLPIIKVETNSNQVKKQEEVKKLEEIE
jgi:RHS repeat-associated protein